MATIRMKSTSIYTGILVSFLGLTGCSSLPQSTSLNDEAAKGVEVSWQSFQDTDINQKPGAWWLLFHDPTLSSLIDQAEQGNYDLSLAVAHWHESRAALGLVQSTRNIQWSVDAGLSRSAFSQDNPLVKLGGSTSSIDSWTLSNGASWEADFWGYLSYKEKASIEQLKASSLEIALAKLSLNADLARTYWQLRGVQSEIAYLKDRIQIATSNYELVQSRERNGVSSSFQTLSAKAKLSDVRSEMPSLRHQEQLMKSSISMLLGLEPHALDAQLLAQTDLPSIPTVLPIGVPSELLKNRPDILISESHLREKVALVNAAHADFYPRVRLSASLGFLSNDLSDLGSWDSREYSFGPSFHLPIFEGGRLKQMLFLTEANQKEAAINYRKTVLSAWHEVENSLHAWQSEKTRLEILENSAQQRRKALAAATRSFEQGVADRSDVLAAQRELVFATQSIARSKVNEALAIVGLYRALGGNWKSEFLPKTNDDSVVM